MSAATTRPVIPIVDLGNSSPEALAEMHADGAAELVAAARRIRSLLEEVSLVCFARTSGGKGLHVVVPLNPGCDWSLVKPFAKTIAESMAAREPARYVATASKSQRKGRIFVDYLRNDRSATSIASWSLRARPG